MSGTKEWIQFDLGVVRSVYSIVTRGRGASEEWITSYQMMHSSDLSDWTTYTDVIGDDLVSCRLFNVRRIVLIGLLHCRSIVFTYAREGMWRTRKHCKAKCGPHLWSLKLDLLNSKWRFLILENNKTTISMNHKILASCPAPFGLNIWCRSSGNSDVLIWLNIKNELWL